MSDKLTSKQIIIYRTIYELINKKGYSPSFEEIGKKIGKKNKSTIYVHLQNLKDKGYIDYKTRKPRTIRITKIDENILNLKRWYE